MSNVKKGLLGTAAVGTAIISALAGVPQEARAQSIGPVTYVCADGKNGHPHYSKAGWGEAPGKGAATDLCKKEAEHAIAEDPGTKGQGCNFHITFDSCGASEDSFDCMIGCEMDYTVGVPGGGGGGGGGGDGEGEGEGGCNQFSCSDECFDMGYMIGSCEPDCRCYS